MYVCCQTTAGTVKHSQSSRSYRQGKQEGFLMTATQGGQSAAIRARVNHPIIDSDGHQVEMGPIFFDYLKAEAGPKVAERLPGTTFDGYTDSRGATLSP